MAEKRRLLDNEIKTHNELKQQFKIREERIETMAGEIEGIKEVKSLGFVVTGVFLL